jgi:hypothetical protein
MNDISGLQAFELIGSFSLVIYAAYNGRKIANYITKGLENFVNCGDKNLSSKINKKPVLDSNMNKEIPKEPKRYKDIIMN